MGKRNGLTKAERLAEKRENQIAARLLKMTENKQQTQEDLGGRLKKDQNVLNEKTKSIEEWLFCMTQGDDIKMVLWYILWP